MNQHHRTHTSEKPYQCTECNSTFIQKGELKRHSRVHTGEKPYQCTECFKSFTLKVLLDRHSKTRTGEKPYQCSACDKAFAQTHLRTNTGDKPYFYNVCDKSLDWNLMTQTGEKNTSMYRMFQIILYKSCLKPASNAQILSTPICPEGQICIDNHAELPCRVAQNAIFVHSAQPTPYVEFLPDTVRVLLVK